MEVQTFCKCSDSYIPVWAYMKPALDRPLMPRACPQEPQHRPSPGCLAGRCCCTESLFASCLSAETHIFLAPFSENATSSACIHPIRLLTMHIRFQCPLFCSFQQSVAEFELPLCIVYNHGGFNARPFIQSIDFQWLWKLS